jgi:hypothetical protein
MEPRVWQIALAFVDQYAWTPTGVLLMAKGARLYQWSPSRGPD